MVYIWSRCHCGWVSYKSLHSIKSPSRYYHFYLLAAAFFRVHALKVKNMVTCRGGYRSVKGSITPRCWKGPMSPIPWQILQPLHQRLPAWQNTVWPILSLTNLNNFAYNNVTINQSLAYKTRITGSGWLVATILLCKIWFSFWCASIFNYDICFVYRGFAVGIYATNTPEACHYVAEDCEANILVVENDAQLQKILKVRDRLPHLRAIIQYTGEPAERYSNVYSVSSLLRWTTCEAFHKQP